MQVREIAALVALPRPANGDPPKPERPDARPGLGAVAKSASFSSTILSRSLLNILNPSALDPRSDESRGSARNLFDGCGDNHVGEGCAGGGAGAGGEGDGDKDGDDAAGGGGLLIARRPSMGRSTLLKRLSKGSLYDARVGSNPRVSSRAWAQGAHRRFMCDHVAEVEEARE